LKKQSPVLLFAVLSSLLLANRALAHDPGLSSVTIRPCSTGLEATLIFAINDAAQLVDLDSNHDGIVTQAEFGRGQAGLESVVAAQLLVSLDGKSASPVSVHSRLDETKNVEVYLTFDAAHFSVVEIQSELIALLPLGHRQYLQIQDSSGRSITEGFLSAAADQARALIAAAKVKDGVRETIGSFVNFLVLGLKHILTGYDHLLFLLGLLVVTRSFVSSLKIITCFTLAHSITLAVATLSRVEISSRIVEPLIAASIVYVGVENLLRGDDSKGRHLLTFGFGLIHGFGFASVLREMGIGSGPGGVALPLFSFNLGVELGQMMIAALALPIIWKLWARPTFIVRFAPACSAIVAVLGSVWFVQRVWMNY